MTFTEKDKNLVRAVLKARRRMEEGTRMDLFAIGYGLSDVDDMRLSDMTIAKVVRQCLHSFLVSDCEHLADGNIEASYKIRDWALGRTD